MATKRVSEAAALMGRRSHRARIAKWGRAEYLRRQREYGSRGGRPPKEESKGKDRPNG
ncbi:MAG TPA: hypothetical protein VE996_04540 [Terriglobales bacterium]|nr:hypothetical protein [Terriglobales bacterium]